MIIEPGTLLLSKIVLSLTDGISSSRQFQYERKTIMLVLCVKKSKYKKTHEYTVLVDGMLRQFLMSEFTNTMDIFDII